MLCCTNRARQSNIENIEKLIEALGHKTGEQLNYLEYRAIVNYLNVAKEAYEKEMTQRTQRG